MRYLLVFGLTFLALTRCLWADPVISEFMASNKKGIVDEDGDHSDWVEIYNPDNTPVSLENWSLTDAAGNLRKWVFPAVTIPAKGYLVVWASSKNRRVPGANLHTNFALSAGGEYLGLVKPDGVTKAAEFAPAFPAQYEDVSYGISSSIQTVDLSKPGSMVKLLVPPTDALGATWRSRTFDDSAWTSGAQPVGFMNYGKTSNPDLSSTLGTNVVAQMGGLRPGLYLRVPMEIPYPESVQKITLKIKFDDGFAAFLNGTPAASSYAPVTASLTANSLATALHYPNSFEEFDLSPAISSLVAGANVLAIHCLNESLASSDAYIAAELTVKMDTGIAPVKGYFNAATPGAQNGGPESVVLPQGVSFSRPAGPFTTSFSLSLTGADAGQQIRYTMAAPSSSPGAALAEPTSASTLYTGPIAISSSQVVRAAVFDAATGQKGAVATVQYLLLETGSTNNTSNFTSNLPIAVADDHGAGQPVDSGTGTYTTSFFYLFEPASGVATLNSTPSVFTRAGLRVRGRSSQSFPKKSYALETWDETDNDLKMPLLGLSKESDWILNGPWKYDDTYIHNAFVYELARRMGYWAPRTRFVEMLTNSNGGKLDYSDYAGLYVLTEKIESGSGRLDITGIEPSDNEGDALTGGYIFKIDAADADDVSWSTDNGIPNSESEQRLVIVEPDADDDTDAQVDYLKGYIQAFENALVADRNGGFATRNYLKYMNRGSWVDYHIIDTLAYNVDGLRLSSFFYKDRNGKIHAGPLWDFDRALGSDDGRDANPRSWSNIAYYFTRDWWGYLFQDPDFVQAWIDRWWQLRDGVLKDANLNALADAMGAEIGNAVGARDAATWTDNAAQGDVYLNEIGAMKTWLTSTASGSLGRTNWLDSQLPGPPTASLASGVVTPGTTVALSGAGTIRYTVSGSDPRPAGGSAASPASTYGAPLTINQTTVLTARRQGAFTPLPSAVGTNWGPPVQRVYLVNESFATTGDLSISEINYDPADPTAAEKDTVLEASASDYEYIEIKNTSERTVNTYEVSLADTQPAAAVKLGAMTLAPGQTVLIVKNKEAFLSRYGNALSGQIAGEWAVGSLNNAGERIVVLDRAGNVIQDLTYPDIASAGSSLNIVDGTTNKSDVPSPGADGPTYAQWRDFHFPAGGPDSQPTADMDGDGANNILEYAHGTNPRVAENQAEFEPVFAVVDANNGSYTYRKAQNRPDAHFQAQSSTDLAVWSDVADTLVSATAGIETRSVAVPIGAEEPGLTFFRLEVGVDGL